MMRMRLLKKLCTYLRNKVPTPEMRHPLKKWCAYSRNSAPVQVIDWKTLENWSLIKNCVIRKGKSFHTRWIQIFSKSRFNPPPPRLKRWLEKNWNVTFDYIKAWYKRVAIFDHAKFNFAVSLKNYWIK